MENEKLISEIAQLHEKIRELEAEKKRLIAGIWNMLDKYDRQLIKTGHVTVKETE